MSVPDLKAVDSIIEAPWNVNVMTPELFEQLLADMKQAGPYGTDPIDIAELVLNGIPTVTTINGAHRLRAAKKLGWKELRVVYHHEVTDEKDAREFNYRRDVERGTIDQFKLAETFKWFVDQGEKQDQIARRFSVDRSTVAKRVGLLNLDPKVKEVLVEKEGLEISHLEPIAILEPRLQKIVTANLHDYNFGGFGSQAPTVKGIEHVVKDVKARDEAEQIFRKHVADAKFKKCPVCKSDPQFSRYQPAPKWFRDNNGHEWSGLTGEQPKRDESYGGQRYTSSAPHPPGLPQHVKSSHKPEEYEAAMWPFLKELWSKVKDIESCSLGGTLKTGKTFSLEYNGFHFSYSTDGEEIEFAVEEITSKEYKKKGLFSRVKPREGMGQGIITKADQLVELEKTTEKFLQEYGKTPRINPVTYVVGTQTTSFIPAAMDKVRHVAWKGKSKK